tara:strand:+ start:369 stop:929 length:561 start_codon:yes stop_codon:yes gene_type:complete
MNAGYIMQFVNYAVEYLPYGLASFFFIVFIGNPKTRTSALFVLVYFIIHAITDHKIQATSKEQYKIEYIAIEYSLIGLDGIFSAIMAMLLLVDKKAVYQAILLCCAVFVHAVVIYHLKEEHTWLSIIIYGYCDELIILIWLTMMAINYGRFVKSFRTIRILLLRTNVYIIRSIKNTLCKYKDEESS